MRNSWTSQKQERNFFISCFLGLPANYSPWLVFIQLKNTIFQCLFHVLHFPSLEQQANPSSCLTQSSSAQHLPCRLRYFPLQSLSKRLLNRENCLHKSFLYQFVQKINVFLPLYTFYAQWLCLPTISTFLMLLPLKYHLFYKVFPDFSNYKVFFL